MILSMLLYPYVCQNVWLRPITISRFHIYWNRWLIRSKQQYIILWFPHFYRYWTPTPQSQTGVIKYHGYDGGRSCWRYDKVFCSDFATLLHRRMMTGDDNSIALYGRCELNFLSTKTMDVNSVGKFSFDQLSICLFAVSSFLGVLQVNTSFLRKRIQTACSNGTRWKWKWKSIRLEWLVNRRVCCISKGWAMH